MYLAMTILAWIAVIVALGAGALLLTAVAIGCAKALRKGKK